MSKNDIEEVIVLLLIGAAIFGIFASINRQLLKDFVRAIPVSIAINLGIFAATALFGALWGFRETDFIPIFVICSLIGMPLFIATVPAIKNRLLRD
jgi:hypothetical protein